LDRVSRQITELHDPARTTQHSIQGVEKLESQVATISSRMSEMSNPREQMDEMDERLAVLEMRSESFKISKMMQRVEQVEKKMDEKAQDLQPQIWRLEGSLQALKNETAKIMAHSLAEHP
jgi:chromosome segregation ATPase